MGAFDHLNGPQCGEFEGHFGPDRGEFEQQFSKKSNARVVARGGMLKLRFDRYIIHWHASSFTLLINILAVGQSSSPELFILFYVDVLNRRYRYCISL